MKIVTLIPVVFTLALLQAGLHSPAEAFELDGAWTSYSDNCKKIFAKAGETIVFAPDAELSGDGFIVEGNSIRGQTAKCTIKARKEADAVTHLLAVCSIGIMVDQMQLSYKVVDDNKITRLFPGMEGFEKSFSRCSFAK